MTHLDSILKSRDITLPTNIRLVGAMVFPEPCMDVRVGLWGKLSAEELMILNCDVGEDSWASLGLARRYNQSILKEISSEHSLEGLMLKLKLQYFGHLMRRTDSFENPWCWERLKAGGEGDDRGWDGWMTSPTQWTWVWVSARSWWWTGKPGVLQSTGLQTQLGNWTEPPVIRWLISSLKRVPEASSFSISGNAFQVVPGALLHIHTVRSVFSLQFYSTLQWLLSCFYALEFRVKLQSASQRTLLSLLPETEI